MAALGVSSVAELEGLLLHEAHKRDSPFSAQIASYFRQHEDLGAADKVFEAATELQRQRIAGQRIAAADAAAVEMAQILPRNDSTSARTDSALRLIAEDERWELWQDSHGRTVRRRKK
jgi:hypothetical protein